MKRTKIYIAVIPFLFIGLLQSCTEEMNISLDTTYTRLVVDAVITSDTASQYVRLAKSADYFYNKPLEPVTGAVVRISDGTNTIQLTEKPEKPGYYYTPDNFYGTAGKTYHLNIENVDIDNNHEMETYTASSIMPSVVKPDSIKVIPSNTHFVDYEVRYYGPEPAETKDFYMFKLRRNGTLLTDTIVEAVVSPDEFYNGVYIKNMGVYSLFKSKKDEDIQAGDTLTLEIAGITEEYNQFLTDLMLEYHGADPFGGQPANVSTNIEDHKKAIGFFTAYSIKRVSYIVKPGDLEKK